MASCSRDQVSIPVSHLDMDDFVVRTENQSDSIVLLSAASAYENVEWIQQLIAFVASLPDSFPLLKIIGVSLFCYDRSHFNRPLLFSLPACARSALGIKSSPRPLARPSSKTASVGRLVCALWSSHHWDNGCCPHREKCKWSVFFCSSSPRQQRFKSLTAVFVSRLQAIQQMHQDIASAVPATFYSLASTPVCPTQGFVRFRQDLSEDALQLLGPEDLVKAVQIFTLQGHPEFVEDIVDEIIGVREAKGKTMYVVSIRHDFSSCERLGGRRHLDGLCRTESNRRSQADASRGLWSHHCQNPGLVTMRSLGSG